MKLLVFRKTEKEIEACLGNPLTFMNGYSKAVLGCVKQVH
jgi:hypothetical protein